MRNLRIAFGLLSTLPVGLPQNWQPGDSGRAALWYPLVGFVIGGITWLGWRLSMAFFPSLVASVLTVMLWVLLSGGLHLDGLADCCDGLFVSAAPERRLEIMKDPRLGTFGGLGLLLLLMLKVASVNSLTTAGAPGILLAASLGRWVILPAGLLPLARASGMGADFSAGLRRSALFFSMLLPLGLAFALGLPGLIATAVALMLAGLVVWLAINRLGGVSGDVFGMLVELTEAAALLCFTFGVK